MGDRRSARIVAVQGLYAWEETKYSLECIQNFDWLDRDVGEEARTFARLLLAGTLEHLQEIDEKIRRHLQNWSFERLTRVDLAILRIGVYALLYQPDIPFPVTIDEAVEIAKKFGSPDSSRFVNGVLDGIVKGTSKKQL
ncbi:MAG: transcription antitermination factor NusB [Spirochaeta sp. LUC14_002_19_P3]|nr:MAG: transcription antitermination factor NusB [Spirochaeta sp. LUC14_002_19_P3]